MSDSAAAWAAFWRQEALRADPRASLGGLPPDVAQVLDEEWRALARRLPRGGRVLDLASGNGAVLRIMARVRPDLRLTGIDSAGELGPAPRGITMRAATSCERLPFPAGKFAAVTSRFGIEYADLSKAAPEAARVLAPQGRMLLLMHHRDGAVLRHSRARHEALRWAKGSGLLERASALAACRNAGVAAPTPPGLAAAPDQARRLFADQRAAWEVMAAMLQALEAGRDAPTHLARLRTQLDQELARLAALEAAALDGSRADELARSLQSAGLDAGPPTPLHGPGGDLLAFRLAARRP